MNPEQEAFETKIVGSISSAGPFDARISFPTGLTVSWLGKPLGNIKMDNVQVTGDVGASLNVQSAFSVADVQHTDFTQSFEWEISGDNLTVNALGIEVPGISLMSKKVTLKGFNGLKGGVKIDNFDLPANDPAGGIQLTLDATTTNPTQVGIELSSLGFQTFVSDTMIAPVASIRSVSLAPGSATKLSLAGRLVPQSSSSGLDAVSDIFNSFIQGKDSNVIVQGASAGPSGISWLNEGIRALQVATVLPNRGGAGDVSFGLQFQGQTIGAVNINNLEIIPGAADYAIDVHFSPQGAAVAAGRTLLQNFLQGVNSDTSILGSQDSTLINSLKEGLSEIRLLSVTIPAIHQMLIQSTSLTFPTNIAQRGVASASFVLANPFTASINLLRVGATATFHNILLGKIDNVDVSSNPIHAGGHNKVSSPALPLNFNLDPVSIIELLTITSGQNDVDLGPLISLFAFLPTNPDFKPPVTSTIDTSPPVCVSGRQFDAVGAILRSLTGLRVDLAINSSVKLDDFATDISFSQTSVPAILDETVLFLIGALAGPVTQHLVDKSVLTFKEANITNLSNAGFDLSLAGSLTNFGPLDANIEFVEPVSVACEDHVIAQINLPPICAAAIDGVPDYRTSVRLEILDLDEFGNFATFLLHSPSFDWTISTPKLRVTALGTIFDNVSLTKNVTFRAFNGFPGLSINNFQLPGDDPAGGIYLETNALIPSQSQIGIELGTVGFQTFIDDTLIGPLTSSNLFLQASSETVSHLTGRIVPQFGQDLDRIGALFSNFLAGKNQTVIAKGDSIMPTGSGDPIAWLPTAFKTLSLDATLSGQKFDVIQAIQLNDLGVKIQNQDEAFAPPASSSFTLAQYKNPFGFSLQVIEAGQNIVLNAQGIDVAQLVLPKVSANGDVSTGNIADLIISFIDQPLKALNKEAFQAMFAQVTPQGELEVNLKGTADVTATTIGDIPISDIPFDVPSSLKGFGSFGGVAELSNVTIAGSGGANGNEFIVSPLTTMLHNPSNISLETVDISFPVIHNGVTIGRAVIDPFNLSPGGNYVQTEFHYRPAEANDTVAQAFLADFLSTLDEIPLTIQGDAQSTPFESLQPALAGLKLSSSLTGLNQPNLITQVNVTITLDTLITNLVSANFEVTNPLDVDLVIEFVQSDGGVDGTILSQFSQPFDNFVIPAHESRFSPIFDNVFLPQGAAVTLGIVPLGVLDIDTASTIRLGRGGYQIPWLKLSQKSVPTTYTLDLSAFSVDDIHRGNSGTESQKMVNATESPAAFSPLAANSVQSVLATFQPRASLKLSMNRLPPEMMPPSASSQGRSASVAAVTTSASEPPHLESVEPDVSQPIVAHVQLPSASFAATSDVAVAEPSSTDTP